MPALTWVLVVLASVAAGELALRLPLAATLGTMSGASRRSARVLASRRISDHWKERVLPAYALRLGLGSLRFLGLVVAVFAPFLLAGLVAPGGPAAWTAALLRLPVMGLACLASIGWILLRRRAVAHG